MSDPYRLPRRANRRRSASARLFLLPSLCVGLAASAPRTTMPVARAAPVSLFEFDGDMDNDWTVVNDGVMGGRSAGFVTIEAGSLRFTGTIVTQGGGFTSVRARRAIDLSGMVGLEMRVRGSGRQFEVELDDSLRANGRSVSRRAPFPSTSEWTVIRVPFDALRSSIFGRSVDAPSIDLARIRGVGIYMVDGQDGAFRLEVDYIRAYAAP
jgi:NADH dehydrogenase [ubiquinone] 1 alpha subcomplex assembly factor 1